MDRLKQLAWGLVALAMIYPQWAYGDTVGPGALSQTLASAGETTNADSFEDEFEDDGAFLGNDMVPEPGPLSVWNRMMFSFNDTFYFGVLKPLASAYRALVPQPVRKGVENFFYNIGGPKRLINCLLQGKGQAAEAEFVRFFMNTTVGVLGFGNPAAKFEHLNPSREDLGQSLSYYGFGEGVFIVWPVLGPSTFRDTLGMVGDSFLHPVSYVKPRKTSWALKGYEKLNDASFRIGDYESLKEASIEPYAAIRDAYIQYRRKMIME